MTMTFVSRWSVEGPSLEGFWGVSPEKFGKHGCVFLQSDVYLVAIIAFPISPGFSSFLHIRIIKVI